MSITVVMATYNGERYIREQLDSIIKQTQKPQRIIVVDDCSNDKTVSIIHDVLKNSEVSYEVIEHKKNQGVAQSFMDGIALADTEYIFLADQDDYWFPVKIKNMMEVICEEDDFSMVVCNAYITDDKLVETGKTMFEYIELPLEFDKDKCVLSSDEALELLLKRNYATGMCMLIRKSRLMDVFPFPDVMVYDSWLAWKLALSGTVVFIQTPYVLYRQHSENVVGAKKSRVMVGQYYQHRKSNKEKFVKKYNYLCETARKDKRGVEQTERALEFYIWRYKLCENSKIYDLFKLLERVVRGDYKDYTPNALQEAMKDMLEVLIGKYFWL